MTKERLRIALRSLRKIAEMHGAAAWEARQALSAIHNTHPNRPARKLYGSKPEEKEKTHCLENAAKCGGESVRGEKLR